MPKFSPSTETEPLTPSGTFRSPCDTTAPSNENASCPVPTIRLTVTIAHGDSSFGLDQLSQLTVLVDVHDTLRHTACDSSALGLKLLAPKLSLSSEIGTLRSRGPLPTPYEMIGASNENASLPVPTIWLTVTIAHGD